MYGDEERVVQSRCWTMSAYEQAADGATEGAVMHCEWNAADENSSLYFGPTKYGSVLSYAGGCVRGVCTRKRKGLPATSPSKVTSGPKPYCGRAFSSVGGMTSGDVGLIGFVAIAFGQRGRWRLR